MFIGPFVLSFYAIFFPLFYIIYLLKRGSAFWLYFLFSIIPFPLLSLWWLYFIIYFSILVCMLIWSARGFSFFFFFFLSWVSIWVKLLFKWSFNSYNSVVVCVSIWAATLYGCMLVDVHVNLYIRINVVQVISVMVVIGWVWQHLVIYLLFATQSMEDQYCFSIVWKHLKLIRKMYNRTLSSSSDFCIWLYSLLIYIWTFQSLKM